MASYSLESDMRHQPAQPAPPSDPEASEPHVNGFPQQKNNISEFPSPPLEHHDKPNGFSAPTATTGLDGFPQTQIPNSDIAASEFSKPSIAATTADAAGVSSLAPYPSEVPASAQIMASAPSLDLGPATPPSAADNAPSQTDLSRPPAADNVATLQAGPIPELSNVAPPPVSTGAGEPPLDPRPTSLSDSHAQPEIVDEVPHAVGDQPNSGADQASVLPPSGDAQVSHGDADSAMSNAVSNPLPAVLDKPETTSSQVATAAPEAHPTTIHLNTSQISHETLEPAAIDSVVTEPSSQADTPDQEMQDAQATSIKLARGRDEDSDEAPNAKRMKTTGEAEAPAADSPLPDAPQLTNDAIVVPTAEAQPAAGTSQISSPSIDSGPMSDLQQKKLLEGLRNIKKAKHSAAFHKPVDVVALNLPQYFDFIKNPMDLGTLEQNLRDRKYPSVDAYVADFNLIIQNCITFNGPSHAVSTAGLNMKAQFDLQLRKLPKSNEPMPVPPQKKRQSSMSAPAPREAKRREPRQSFGTAPSPSGEAFALGPNGVPLIRRDSTAADGRPKREIHRPKPKDLPYSAKPKKKRFLMELKFCEHVQTEMMRGRYKSYAYPFYDAVDPVAMNLPNYLKIVKSPRDMGLIGRNLKSGQYENAQEYKNDVKLMFNNCYLFNPNQDGVNIMGHQYEAVFDDLWKEKDDWIAANKPASERPSPEADSESEEEEDEEEAEEDQRVAALSAIQQQMARLNEQAQALLHGKNTKPAKAAKTKPSKGSKPAPVKKSRGSSGGGAGGLPIRAEKKAKKESKGKVKPVTIAQKQEISDKVQLLDNALQGQALDIIVKSLRAVGRHEDARKGSEGEFDIERIPDETLHELLKMVRRHIPNNNAGEDTVPSIEQRPSTSHRTHKTKKNKPMSKYEQEDRISTLKGQLESFKHPGSASQSPELPTPGDYAVSSGDESDSGSESEEE